MSNFWSDLSAALVPGILTLFGAADHDHLAPGAAGARALGHRGRGPPPRGAAFGDHVGHSGGAGQGLTGSAAVTAAITHASASVPDAIRGLPQAATTVLTSIAEAKLREALAKVAG